MAFTFAESDLQISQTEIDALKATLANTGVADAFTHAISEAIEKVNNYTLRYAISDDRYRRFVRTLVLYEVYTLVNQGKPAQEHQKRYDEVMAELKDIRDGKFPDLAIKSPSPIGTLANLGDWGSGHAQIKTR